MIVTHRPLTLAIAVAAAGSMLALTACGDSTGPETTEDPGDSTTGEAPGESDDGATTAGGASANGTTTTGASGETGETDGTDATSEGMEDTFGPGPWDHGYPIPHEDQVPGDPQAGYEALLTRGYVSCGVPYTMFQLAKGLLGPYADGPALPGREGKNALVPFNWTVHSETKSGAEVAALNCLTCHAGYVNGELMVGAGRADGDFTVDMGALVGAIPIPDLPILGLSELAAMQSRYEALGRYTQMHTIGSNPADMIAVVLAAHRDPVTLNWSDEALEPITADPIPIDTPAWWRSGKKSSLFHNGMARGDKRGTMMFASSLCTDTVAEAEMIMSYFNDVNAYIQSIEPPPYPFTIDEDLAGEGELLFVDSCAGCHGTYADDPADDWYPNLIIPTEIIGTDPTLADYGVDDVAHMVEWYNSSYYGAYTRLEPGNPVAGYTAPPLDGVWATAPFFHNGSVPTIEGVLNSAARPTYWKRVDYDSTNLDEDALGWPYVETAYGQQGAPEDERIHIFDTSLHGHKNTGHPFGDAFSPGERRAVIEYLKTL